MKKRGGGLARSYKTVWGIKEPADMAGLSEFLESVWWESSGCAMTAEAPPTYTNIDWQVKKLTKSPSSSQ